MKTTSLKALFPLRAIWTICFFGWFLAGCLDSAAEDKTLKIAVSADMRFTMDSIVERYEKKTGITCEVISGSSGILATQIKKGAPYDLFFSANEQFTKDLYTNKLAEKPQTFATGQLVFVYSGKERFSSIETAISSKDIKRIGQADEIGAPYGKATAVYMSKQAFKNTFDSKKVVGESIEQVNHFLESGAVDAIFTSYSFVVKNQQKYPFLLVDHELYPAIRQSSVVLSKGGNASTAATTSFMNYFRSAESKAIIAHFGYIVQQ